MRTMNTDTTATIQNLKDKILSFQKERNWTDYHQPRHIAVSICLEAAELLEIFQWNDKNDMEALKKDDSYQQLKDELADVLIYCMTMATAMRIDVAECIDEKMKKNAVKYPV